MSGTSDDEPSTAALGVIVESGLASRRLGELAFGIFTWLARG